MTAPLFLIGFMAAGKTSVGRALAHEAGRRFVDLDDVIAAGGEPVAALVARDEPEFRRREAAALGDTIAAAGDGPVIATGGGAAAFGDNLARMRDAGLVVALGVDVADAQARAAGGPARPLLASATELARRRAASYRRAHAVVDTTGRTIAEVVRQVRDVERAWIGHRAWAPTVVALGARSYPVVVGERFELPELAGFTRIAVITDDHVAAHHGAALIARLGLGDRVDTISLAPGEASKSFAVYQRVCEELVARGLDRQSAIVALGGGVVGDLAGFVAATLFRGIPVFQLPTTLVAMTDAAIGGKTAVDLPAGKNLVGAFWQPRLVQVNLATLATLPARERQAGFGELWKYALLDGPALWQAVDACTGWATAGGPPPPALREVIERSIAYKAAIVGRDELEQTGHRVLLNLGHTVGHGIESETGLHHGEAVGLGLIAACRVSAALGLAPGSLEAEVAAAVARAGLPAELDRHLSEGVLSRLTVDKKRVGSQVRFVAIREVGSCEPVAIEITELRRILRPSSAA